jgi:predicted ribosomally synthesized peptide with nif11-like leader
VVLPRKPRVTFEQFRHFLSRVQRDPALRRQVEEAITADEVARLAQELGFSVSGSDILRFSGQSAAGVRVTRIDHPGEYPGRYY